MDTLAKNEVARVAALNRYAILDTEPEQSFDDLVTLASYVCKTPMAFLSLVDDHRQWFKSKIGVEVRETPSIHRFARTPSTTVRKICLSFRILCRIHALKKTLWWFMSHASVSTRGHL